MERRRRGDPPQKCMLMLRNFLLVTFFVVVMCFWGCQRSTVSLTATEIICLKLWSGDSMGYRLCPEDTFRVWEARKFTEKAWETAYRLEKENDSLYFGAHYFLRNDSLYLDDFYCPTTDTVVWAISGRSMELYKSDYNRPDSADEECEVYWNSDFGVILAYNYPWNVLLVKEVKSPRYPKMEEIISAFMKGEMASMSDREIRKIEDHEFILSD